MIPRFEPDGKVKRADALSVDQPLPMEYNHPERVISMANQTIRMTEGPVGRHLLRFAIPLFWGNLFQQLYNVADSLVVGNFLGEDALAAVASSTSIICLLVGFFTGTFMGASVVIARYFGEQNDDKLRAAIHTSVAFGLFCGVFVSLFGVYFTPHLLRWMGTPESVMPNSVLYFRVYFSGVLFSVMYNVASGIFQALGDTRHPLVYLVISSVVNVALDILFIAGFGMGVDGAALATVIAQALSCLLAYTRLSRSRDICHIEWRKIGVNWPILGQLLALGVPSGLQYCINSIGNIVAQSSINLFGAAAMGGCGAYWKVEGFAFLSINSCTSAASTFVGQNLGAKEHERARKGAAIGIISCMLLAEATGLLFVAFAPQIIGLFGGGAEVVTFGVMHARIACWFYFLIAMSNCSAGVLRGAGMSVTPMFIITGSWCVLRVLYLIFIARPAGVLDLVLWGYPITWLITFVLFLIVFCWAASAFGRLRCGTSPEYNGTPSSALLSIRSKIRAAI